MSHLERVEKACQIIKRAQIKLTLENIAKEVSMSPFHFQKTFKKITGLTPKQYEMACKKDKFKDSLKNNHSITQAIYNSGHNSTSQIYKDMSMLGMKPREFKKGGLEQEIMLAVGQCSLGVIMIAQTCKGICAISLGDEIQPLLDQVQKDFPNAKFVVGDEKFEKNMAYVIGFIDNGEKKFQLPLDIQGTLFQKKVWHALKNIPLGKTINYSQLAEQIGCPQATRAVANACGSNKLAIAIPCHRVIQKNGKISGYRWGTERKKTILEKEKINL